MATPEAYARRMLLHAAVPFTKWIGRQHMPFTHKLTTEADFRAIERLQRTGDILLSRYRGEPTNIAIEGFYTHTAQIAPPLFDHPVAVEAIGRGVGYAGLAEFVLHHDYVALLRPHFLTAAQAAAAAAWSAARVGVAYNWTFDMPAAPQPVLQRDGSRITMVTSGFSGNNGFYCAELPACAMRMQVPGAFLPKRVMGLVTYEPQDYMDATQWFDVLYVSAATPPSALSKRANTL